MPSPCVSVSPILRLLLIWINPKGCSDPLVPRPSHNGGSTENAGRELAQPPRDLFNNLRSERFENNMPTKRHIPLVLFPILVSGLLAACVPAQQYDALENDYNQLNQQLSGEISSQQVHITRLQGAIKVAVNSELLFPSGGSQMPPAAAETIAKMAPILAPFQKTTIIVTGYTDNVPIGPELRAQGVTSNQQLSLMRAQTVANYLVSQGVNPALVSARGLGDADPVASNDTPQGRAQNRRVELTLAGPGT